MERFAITVALRTLVVHGIWGTYIVCLESWKWVLGNDLQCHDVLEVLHPVGVVITIDKVGDAVEAEQRQDVIKLLTDLQAQT